MVINTAKVASTTNFCCSECQQKLQEGTDLVKILSKECSVDLTSKKLNGKKIQFIRNLNSESLDFLSEIVLELL